MLCVTGQALCPEEKFLLTPFRLRNGRFPWLRERVNVITVRTVFFFLRNIGRVVLLQVRKSKSPGWIGSSFAVLHYCKNIVSDSTFNLIFNPSQTVKLALTCEVDVYIWSRMSLNILSQDEERMQEGEGRLLFAPNLLIFILECIQGYTLNKLVIENQCKNVTYKFWRSYSYLKCHKKTVDDHWARLMSTRQDIRISENDCFFTEHKLHFSNNTESF